MTYAFNGDGFTTAFSIPKKKPKVETSTVAAADSQADGAERALLFSLLERNRHVISSTWDKPPWKCCVKFSKSSRRSLQTAHISLNAWDLLRARENEKRQKQLE
ncbi:hypothetical protein QR680_002534 [Steinernema hermaphroditum]|uniref:Uncharacterized protein n=1 Tax=Steinernema hermaphroditum TaxID=289476 RepID=A0AA39H3Z3_9BILA|nr:hypothetical protein QR680_002534 [Steinernema hermaphroditum]